MALKKVNVTSASTEKSPENSNAFGQVHLLYFSMNVFRLIGGLPFRIVKIHNIITEPESQNSRDFDYPLSIHFQSSIFWQIYNVSICILILACVSFLGESLVEAQEYYSDQSFTLKIAMIVSNLLELSMSSLSFIYLCFHRNQLCNLLSRLICGISNIRRHRESSGWICVQISLALLFCLASGGITVLQLSQFFREYSSYIIVEVLMVTIFTLLKVSVCSLYLASIEVLGCSYKQMAKELKEFLNEKRSFNGAKENNCTDTGSECEKSTGHTRFSKKCASSSIEGRCNFFSFTVVPLSSMTGQNAQTGGISSCSEEYHISDACDVGMMVFLRACYRQILLTYSTQEILHQYVGLPICILLLYALCSGIISMFFLTHYHALAAPKIIVVCLYLVAAFCPVIFLVNLPVRLMSKVSISHLNCRLAQNTVKHKRVSINKMCFISSS